MERSKDIRKDYPWFYPMILGAFLVVAGIVIGGFLFGSDNPVSNGNMLSYVTNLWTEFISIGITIFVIDRLYRNREEKERAKREDQADRTRVSIALTSSNKDIQQSAFDEALVRGFLIGEESLLSQSRFIGVDFSHLSLSSFPVDYQIGDSLWTPLVSAFYPIKDLSMSQRQVDFSGSMILNTSMEGAKVRYTKFDNSTLWLANLNKAIIIDSSFNNANLRTTTMKYASFHTSSFRAARFDGANMNSTSFQSCNFGGVDFTNADLKDAQFLDCVFDDKTILPDSGVLPHHYGYSEESGFSSIKYWTPETDMTRYTNPEHPDFWQPDWVKEQENV